MHLCSGRLGLTGPCFDPQLPKNCPKSVMRPALVSAFDQVIQWEKTEDEMRALRESADRHGAELVLLLPQDGAEDLTHAQKRIPMPKRVEQFYKIIRVPWITPPNLSAGIPREG